MSTQQGRGTVPGMRPAPQPIRQHGTAAAGSIESPKRPVESPERPVESPERVMRTCPICTRELAERKCKLYCPDPRCGYFLSCADYY